MPQTPTRMIQVSKVGTHVHWIVRTLSCLDTPFLDPERVSRSHATVFKNLADRSVLVIQGI